MIQNQILKKKMKIDFLKRYWMLSTFSLPETKKLTAVSIAF